jgi:hypothetical protein
MIKNCFGGVAGSTDLAALIRPMSVATPTRDLLREALYDSAAGRVNGITVP